MIRPGLQPIRIARDQILQRNKSIPVGWVNHSGFGSGTVGQKIRKLLLTEQILLVVMPDDWSVYAINPYGSLAAVVELQHPEWLVGLYTIQCGKLTIGEGLAERAKEIRRKAETS